MRIADEVCLQMHLLDLSFQLAVRARAESEEQAAEICRKQLVGIAGIAAERIHRALGLPADEAGALRTLSLHPLLNPAAYVDAAVGTDGVRVQHGPAHDDGAWIARCGPDAVTPLQAVVRAVDPSLDVEVEGDAGDWYLHVVRGEPAKEADEVAVTRFSTGSGFAFEPRRSIPITPGLSRSLAAGRRTGGSSGG